MELHVLFVVKIWIFNQYKDVWLMMMTKAHGDHLHYDHDPFHWDNDDDSDDSDDSNDEDDDDNDEAACLE